MKILTFFYTYVLRSKKDDELYVGSTDNLKRRKAEHDRGDVESTKNRRPLILIYYEATLLKKRAEDRERYFKTSWGKRFLKTAISPATPVE